MVRQNILLVDDDPVTLMLLRKRIKKIKMPLSVQTSKDGISALKLLKEKDICLILADLQMPKMDGFVLLDHLREKYPDIPVIIMTAHARSRTETVVLEKGAAAFFSKPFNINDLIDEMIALLHKQMEGGSLFSASLEMFVQLLEMEQKTVTLRVINKLSERKGVLFFKDGDLLNARTACQQGEAAAYDIFSWDQTVLYIEEGCSINIKKIDQDLQAILFEAMRLKDEAAENKAAGSDVSTSEASQTNARTQIESKMQQAFPEEARAVAAIKTDDSWNRLLQSMMQFGADLQFGRLQACYINQGEPYDTVVIPGDDTIVLSVRKKCFHDRILEILE